MNLQQKQRSAAEDSHSLAGAVGNRAEVSWRKVPGGWSTSLLNSAHLLRSEGLTAFHLSAKGKTRRSERMSLRVGHLCGRSSESVVKLECKRSVSGSFATVSPVRWKIERRFLGARSQECRSTKPSELSVLAELRGFDRFIS